MNTHGYSIQKRSGHSCGRTDNCPPMSRGGGRETLRVFLGTIPDYSTNAKGVKITETRGDSPAEKGSFEG